MEQKKLQLTGGNIKNDRRELDFYPTPPEATIALMEFLKLPFGIIVREPASGDGSMSKVIEKYVSVVLSSDIREDGYGTGGVDYTAICLPLVGAIITNPPFNLSELFITKSLSEAPIVAMLLKSQYWHAKKRIGLFESNPPAWVLPLTWRPDFLGGSKGGSPTMEVCWTVWIYGDMTTKYLPLKKPFI